MKIYTKTGDDGTTSLFGGTRVPKYHINVESYGTIDELNAHLGLICSSDILNSYQTVLQHIQKKLFDIGAILASEPEKNILTINSSDILFLEHQIDLMNADLPKMTNFILPGGHVIVSYCHIARCVCRRAERLIVSLNEGVSLYDDILRYINRLSDYLFVLSRHLAKTLNVDEIKWIPEKTKRK